MKKTVLILVILTLILGALFANGAPEEQKLFFENLMRNSHQPSSTGSGRSAKSVSGGSEIISRDMSTLERLYQYVDKNFLYDIDYDAVYEAMATALFDALGDKYTYYVKADESENYVEEVSGTYGGIGIYFSKTYVNYQNAEDESTLYAVITQVFPNTPSAKAGFRTGDYIIEINGESVVDKEATDCAKLMKGEAGTSVDITIKRGDSTFTISVNREIITVPTVEYEMIDSDTAYLRILEFSSSTYSSIDDALSDLASLGMKKLIIDLRSNPGGDVDETLAIADMFISGTELLSISYKDSSKDVTYVANDKITVSPDVDVAILINGGTASSAEIFSATMRDNGRAVLFGTTSYGKGVMQVISSFGTGYTSITTASFVGPSGTIINGEGVKPDFEVEDIYVLDEELDAYTKIMNSKTAKKFVDENPEFSEENMAEFASEYADTGLREEVLLLIVRNEYRSRLSSGEAPLADIVYDAVCKAAYEYLQTYENDYKAGGSEVVKKTERVVNF